MNRQERGRAGAWWCAHTILSLFGTSVRLREGNRAGLCDPALMEVLKVMFLCAEGLLPTHNTFINTPSKSQSWVILKAIKKHSD